MSTTEPAPRLTMPTVDGFLHATPLDRAMERFAAAAVRRSGVDPLTSELVRLRCAQYHDCRLCGSLRLEAAMDEGLDEAMVAKIANYETSDLDARSKAALRFTDAMIIRPVDLDDDLRRQVREHFDDAQIAELAFDVMKWSHQKLLVALRLETPPWDGIATLSFDEAGEHRIGGSISAASAG